MIVIVTLILLKYHYYRSILMYFKQAAYNSLLKFGLIDEKDISQISGVIRGGKILMAIYTSHMR